MPGYSYNGSNTDVFTWSDGDEAWDALFAQHGTQHRARLANLVALLERLGDTGQLRSPDQIHTQQDNIYAVKQSYGFRAYGWFDNRNGKRCFVIGHACLKKEDKAEKKSIGTCIELRKKFQEQQRQKK